MAASKASSLVDKTVPVLSEGKDVLMRDLVLVGDLSRFSPDQKVEYYLRVCEALGLNPVTRPLEFMVLQGKTILYAKKDATDQIRKKYCVSITDMKQAQIGDLYVVTVTAQDGTGRTDLATGVLDIKGLLGNNLANAMMKCETKAKRRVTLSIGGLGMLDETELETVPSSPAIDLSPDEKKHGDIKAALTYIAKCKTEDNLNSAKKKCDLNSWTEEEEFQIDEALKNKAEEIKEGAYATAK